MNTRSSIRWLLRRMAIYGLTEAQSALSALAMDDPEE